MTLIDLSLLALTLMVLAPCLQSSEGAKILAIFPIPGKSHMIINAALSTELARRGHELTVISPFPEKSPPPNYKEIIVKASRDDFINGTGVTNSMDLAKVNIIQMIMMLWGIGNSLCDQTLQHPAIQDLIHSKYQQFDLIIIEGFFLDCFLGFVHRFKVPFVQIVSFGGAPFMHDWIGNPNTYSYIPDPFQEFSDKMNFWERLVNTVGITFQKVTREFFFVPDQQKLMEKYFGKYGPLPSINELLASTSVMLVNHHFSIGYPRPMLPNLVEVGGLHIKPPKELPEDLKKFIDEAPDGVIYFSFGSGFYSSDMPEEKIKSFVDVFSKLKQKILWKWDKDSLPGQPKNVKLGKWLPQSDILAHPNVRLFITHGGLLSTQETIYRGVPVVAIPLTADQKLNTARGILAGYGVKVDYSNITTESLNWALKEVLENPRYHENTKRISEIFKDQPQSPLEQAVFWTEYVIRHKGAPHMRCAALDLAWYQYFLLDVIAVLAFTVGSVFLVLFLIVKAVFKKCCGSFKCRRKSQIKKKKN